MRKKLVTGVLTCVMVMSTAVSAFACGGRHHSSYYSGYSNYPTYTLCAVEGCTETGVHYHDGVSYSGHYLYDGHSYHQNCGIDGCVGYYGHNGYHYY